MHSGRITYSKALVNWRLYYLRVYSLCYALWVLTHAHPCIHHYNSIEDNFTFLKHPLYPTSSQFSGGLPTNSSNVLSCTHLHFCLSKMPHSWNSMVCCFVRLAPFPWWYALKVLLYWTMTDSPFPPIMGRLYFQVFFLMSSLLEVSQFLRVRSKSEHSDCGLDLLFLLCLACPVSKTPPSLQELLRWHFIKMPSTLSHIWFLTFILSHLPPPHIGSITSPTVSLCQFLKPEWRGMPCPPESC